MTRHSRSGRLGGLAGGRIFSRILATFVLSFFSFGVLLLDQQRVEREGCGQGMLLSLLPNLYMSPSEYSALKETQECRLLLACSYQLPRDGLGR